MTEQTSLETIADVLRGATEYLTLQQIVGAAKVEESVVKAALRLLASAGQIDHIPGAGRTPTRYAWLATTAPVVGADAGAPADAPASVTLDALRDDIAASLRMSGIAAFSGVTAESDLPMAVAGLVEEYRKAQAQPAPAGPEEPQGAAYLVRAPKRRPRIMRDADTARAAALAAARNGSGRAEVFALIPIGAAKRGAEWSEAR